MLHDESQSVSRMKENFTSGLTGRDWEPTYDLVNKSLRNRKSGATGYQVYEARHQSFTLLVYLAQLVENSIQQLARLQSLLQNGRDSLNLLRDINRGINDSLQVVDSIAPYIDPGLYQNLKKLAQVSSHIEGIYGVVVKSKDEVAQKETDQAVSEAIHLNNALFEYAKNLDKLGEEIKNYSHSVSPGGAQKLTAQTLGAMIHLQNQQLRATATGLKLSAQSLALQNKQEKANTAEFLRQSQVLKSAMNNPPKFQLPRF